MSETRIPCPNCGASILEVTAKFNDGMCAPCGLEKQVADRERAKAEARRNAPPPLIDYSRFSRKDFVEALTLILRQKTDDPSGACSEFLGFCDPILQSEPRTFLGSLLDIRRGLYPKLKRIPRPFRELMAVYQAWGMVSSDGLESYLEQTTSAFDDEVDSGLALLGHPEVAGLMTEARSVYRSNAGEIPKENYDDLWSRFIESLPDFETRILGPELLRRL